MEKKKLVEIKKGESGTGLLIEHDGFISMDSSEVIKESIGEDDWHCPHPFIVNAVLQRFGAENANGRIYPEGILKREVEKYQQKIDEKRAIAELNHPSESVIDLGRIAINVVELHWQGNTLCGKVEILTTPGFRKYGIVSTCGDETANLLLHGIKIGLSSRGLGTVQQRMGALYVADDYELVCFDVVSDPSTHNAWLVPDGEIPEAYMEGKENNKPSLIEGLSKFNDWLND